MLVAWWPRLARTAVQRETGKVQSSARAAAGDAAEKAHLVEDIQERVVVCRAEDLGDEGAALRQELGRKPASVKGQLRLRVGILRPRSPDIRRAVAQHLRGARHA